MQLKQRTLPQNTSTLPYPEIIQRVFAARGVLDTTDLQFSLKQLIPVRQLRHVTHAAELLADAIEGHHTVVIVGDYDADGATATALTLRCLRLMGHTECEFIVPDRFKYGYGLTPAIVDLAQRYQPWLLMTVDNGVSSIEGVEAAHAKGYKTLITDHHLTGKQLPACNVMVNPNHPEDTFPSKHLSGVGVVFYVMLALKQVLMQRNYFQTHAIPEPNLTTVLDLVALGTVADVVPLDANNRILVEQGLRRIRSMHGNAGIQALMQLGKHNPLNALSTDLGFVCGPRLNAAGRLADMSIGIRCLLSDNPNEALQLAQQLEDYNQERRKLEASMKTEAEQLLQNVDITEQQNLPPILCLHQPQWHEGVIGILASRLKDKYYRPTFVFATAQDGLIKGSGRSIMGLHLRDLLEEVATAHPHLITRFGGHAMAAGLTLPPQHLPAFMQYIEQAVQRKLTPETFNEIQYTDGEFPIDAFTLPIAELLQRLAPWGQHFPEPYFEGEFELLNHTVLKESHLKLIVRPYDKTTPSSICLDAIAFSVDWTQWHPIPTRARLLFSVGINEFKDKKKLQLQIIARLT